MDPTPEEVRAFVRRHGISYTIVLDPDEKIGRRYRLEGHPTTILIDGRGIVRYVHVGFLRGDEKEIEAALQAVLQGRPVPEGAR
jgi:cytochrome c biogenesis protein CcmG, thiol:disulfide interchange protein DsbE